MPKSTKPRPAKTTAPAKAATVAKRTKAKSKLALMLELLRRPEGATIDALVRATGWQAHSVRGALAGSIKKKQGLTVVSEKTEAGRVYRVTAAEGA